MSKEKKFTSAEVKCCVTGFIIVAPGRTEMGAFRVSEDTYAFETLEGVEEWLKENLEFTEYE